MPNTLHTTLDGERRHPQFDHPAATSRRWLALVPLALAGLVQAETPPPELTNSPASDSWNWHVQNTDIAQLDPGFPAKYSGVNSLHSGGELRESVSLDLMAGIRVWRGGEAHVDGMMWQGFGLSKTLGVEGFPNGESFRLGTSVPNVNLARLFFRQTIGLGGDTEAVEDDALNLAGSRDISRITLTLGKMSAKDVFDQNAYSADPRTQFMNWGLMANEAWDFPADALGYITGMTLELNQPDWATRYGFFQMPRVSNGTALDPQVLQAWGMVEEFEYRHKFGEHPGTVRLLAFLNRAHMGSYEEAVAQSVDIAATRAYRLKYGFGLNLEQELAQNLGCFARLGWSDGQNEGWAFSDVDKTISGGFSLKGALWHREHDTFGIAGVFNGITGIHQQFLAQGGTGILAGDGNLTYGWEKILETYYDFRVWKRIHTTIDYQFIANPAFNRDRGPVSVVGLRLHWEL